jgi:hypothetical protein
MVCYVGRRSVGLIGNGVTEENGVLRSGKQ